MRITIALLSLIWLASQANADPLQRVATGFGSALTPDATPQEIVIRQTPNAGIVSNGTFAADTDWVKGTDWTISGGTAVFTTTNKVANGTFSNTNSWGTNASWQVIGGVGLYTNEASDTGSIWQAGALLGTTSGTVYNILWTMAATNGDVGVTVCFDNNEGTRTGTARKVTGTWIETVSCYSNNARLIFYATNEGAAVTASVDNVQMRVAGLVETNTIYETLPQLTVGKTYRIGWTTASMDPGTNTLAVGLGDNYETARTTNATYSSDLIFTATASQLLFRAIATNISSFTLDNVTIRELESEAYAQIVTLHNLGTIPLYYLFNCDAVQFTNAYTYGTTCILDTNQTATIDVTGAGERIHKLWYRSAATAGSVYLNAH